jgi:hypothetical protein
VNDQQKSISTGAVGQNKVSLLTLLIIVSKGSTRAARFVVFAQKGSSRSDLE